MRTSFFRMCIKHNRCALIDSAFNFQPAAVRPHDLFHQSKAKPHPALLLAPGAIHHVKWLGDALELFTRDAAAMVTHSKARGISGKAYRLSGL